ncbi:sulfotransferase, partial [Pantoea sp. SIMBA_072]
PASALPSLCSVLREARSILEEGVDTRAIGEREASYWGAAVEDAHRARARAPGQFLDILQQDIQRQPMAVIQTIYQHF